MSDTSLIFSIIARDKTTAILNRLESRASSVGKTIGMALGPALLPAAAVGTSAVISLGAAMAGAGVAAGVFGAVAKTAMTEVTEAATKVEDLNDKMQLYGREAKLAAAAGMDNEKYLKKQAEAALELKARLANLPPETRNATMAFLGMKNNWKDFVDQNKPATFGVMTSGYTILGQAIRQLQPFFDMGALAARRLVGAVGGMVSGGGLTRLAATAGPALQTLTSILINVGTAVTRTFGKIGAAQGQGILEWIEGLTDRWVVWASATQRGTGINKFIEYVSANGPTVMATLTSFAVAAAHIAQAVAPLAPISMAIAQGLAAVIAAVPPPVITALVAGFIAFNTAMRLYALGSALATAAQWAMNTALLASPITWIVLGIVALVAAIVWVATKTKFFQTVWAAVWGFMKGVGAWFAGPFANFFVRMWHRVVAEFVAAKNAVMHTISNIKGFFIGMWNTFSSVTLRTIAAGIRLVNWFRAAPGKVRSALGSMFSGLWSGFRGYVNRIIGAWNRLQFTIGGGSFMGISIPSFSVGTPNIPYMATGGQIRRDGLIFAHAGEQITKRAQVTRTGPGTGTGRGGGGATITINGGQAKVIRVLLELLREGIRDQGGDVVKVLAPR